MKITLSTKETDTEHLRIDLLLNPDYITKIDKIVITWYNLEKKLEEESYMQQKKKTGCLTWIGYVFIAILIMAGIGLFGSDGEDENKGSEEYSVDSDDGRQAKARKEERTAFKAGKIYNGHKCKLKLADGNDDGFSVEITNKSKKDYSFDIHSMAINGIMTNCNIYTASTGVPSGKKGTMQVDFDREWLNGAESVAYVDFVVWAYDDAKSFKDFETEVIRIKTNKFKKESKFNGGKGAKRSNGLIIQKEKLDTEEFVFSVINKNDYFVEFDFKNSSINGWAFKDDYLFDAKGVCVYPDCKSTVRIDLSDFSETNKLKKIKNIEFSLGVRGKGDYFKERETNKIKFK